MAMARELTHAGTVLILGSGTLYKIILRTKLRDPAKADLQAGRRPLNIDEIKMLDEYYSLPKWRRILTYIQLW